MDFVAELIMDAIPDFFTDFFGEKIFGCIRARIENKYLRGVLYVLTVLLTAVIGVGLAFGLLLLIGWLIYG